MHCARAADAHAAAKFRACQLQLISQHPQQRHPWIVRDRLFFTIYYELHNQSLLIPGSQLPVL
jgi:hypothetical protein